MASTFVRTIIITRPEQQAESFASRLSEMLRDHSVNILSIPLLKISALESDDDVQQIKNKILNLDHYQKIIFVSQNAVAYGMAWIDNYWPQLPTGLDFFAIGTATAQALNAWGVAAKNLAQDEASAMTSEVLLQSPELQQVTHEKILIVRGQGGRGHLGDVLAERGAWVHYCEVYHRSLPEPANPAMAEAFAAAESLQQLPIILSLHSGEALENFVKIIATWPKAQRDCAYNAQLLVPSERVARLAVAAGFHAVIQAENATDACMLRALENTVGIKK